MEVILLSGRIIQGSFFKVPCIWVLKEKKLNSASLYCFFFSYVWILYSVPSLESNCFFTDLWNLIGLFLDYWVVQCFKPNFDIINQLKSILYLLWLKLGIILLCIGTDATGLSVLKNDNGSWRVFKLSFCFSSCF